MKSIIYKQADRLWILAMMTLFIHLSSFIVTNAQTNVVLDPACQSCPPSATLNSNAATPVPTPVPSCGTVAGTYKVGTALTAANTITISLNVLTAGAYSITTTATNGMTFTGSGTFAGTGSQTVVLTGSGTPLTAGTTGVLVQYGGSTCSALITVASNAPTAVAGTGNLSGKTCFDIALSNDNVNNCSALSDRLVNKSDFTLAAVNQQIYTFTPSGTVSNVRFMYVNTNGNVITAITGGNTGNNISTPVTATASFNTSLNTLALGLTNSNPLTADIYVIYNDGATNNGTDRQLKLTARVKDCICCGAMSQNDGVTKFLEFMCHNLGADESKDPFSYSEQTIGDLYQWGRPKDGHEKRFSALSNVRSNNKNGADSYFFVDHNHSVFTTDMSYYTNWGDVSYAYSIPKGTQDPCPPGYKIPTGRQWMSLCINTTDANYNGSMGTIFKAIPNGYITECTVNTVSMATYGYFIGPNLYLPVAGGRAGANVSGYPDNSQLYAAGVPTTSPSASATYQTSTLPDYPAPGTYGAWNFTINNLYTVRYGDTRAEGLPIRCVADN